ncbi:MAG: PQQ-binding-like beta-propeller repeat protein [Planctomycetes bacterium]|nr:PQQ-binding-like beta-propeller repeat protein [Planctomycetota bacterium]
MKKLTGLLVVLLLSALPARAQDLSKTYSRPTGPNVGSAVDMEQVLTHPAVPSPKALDRLNLQLAWHVYVPIDGRRDGLFGVQILDDMILVQSCSGMITALDPRDGSTLWRASPGASYRVSLPAAFNSYLVFVARGSMLFALDRKTGQQQWQFALPETLAATPAADEDRIYLPAHNNRMYVYQIPRTAPEGSPSPNRPGFQARPGLTDIEYQFDYVSQSPLEQQPLLVEDLVVLAATDGTFFAISKYERKLVYQFKAESFLSASPGYYRNMAYVASQDFNLYALDVVPGRIVWTFTGAAPILEKPRVQDQDIYLVPYRAGLYRLDRRNGEPLWRGPNEKVQRFVAANPKFVYGVDRLGRLLILDRASGADLALLDTSDFVVPVSNDLTDRIFLAANDGLLVCLHDRAYPNAVVMKAPPPRPGNPPARPAQNQPAATAPASSGAGR